MGETLLSGSAILMYGREMEDLGVDETKYTKTGGAANETQLYNQLTVAAGANDARLARIYAFSCGGEFYPLASPTIFLVHGKGIDPGSGAGAPFRKPADVDETGVAAQAYDFSKDLMMWTYDKNDISVRLDLSTGKLEDILLAVELDDDGEHPSFGGGRVGGGRVGGGRVGGGRVGGGRVGGGRVGGGRVGGGRVGGG